MNIYTSMPHLGFMLSDHLGHRAIGELGECIARLLLEKSGYMVITTRIGQKRGDLVAINRDTGEVFKIDVKTARRGKSGKWTFTLFKSRGHTDYRLSDFVLLLPVLKSGAVVPFVVPRSALGERSTLKLASNPREYAGKWATYRQSTRRLVLEVEHV